MNASSTFTSPLRAQNLPAPLSDGWQEDGIAVVPPPTAPEGKSKPLQDLTHLGQSVWLDDLSRGLLRSGELEQLIQKEGLSGVISNPATFEKAVTRSKDYDADIKRFARQGKGAEEIYETLIIDDLQAAADVLQPVYDRTQKQDGYVSVAVSPHSAYHSESMMAQARRLWHAVGRPNVLIQVPATAQGLSAIRRLVAEGINVNVTLFCDLLRYRGVLEAWISGLDTRAGSVPSVSEVACVAGFSLSRMDVLLDSLLESAAARGQCSRDCVWQMRGQTAVATAKVANVIQERFHAGFRYTRLKRKGAQPLRLLWAGTRTNHPDYSDLKYVEPLIGSNTVVSMAVETLDAYRDHGHPALRLGEGLDEALKVLYSLPRCGFEIHGIAQQLEMEGINQCVKAYEAGLNCIRSKSRDPAGMPGGRATCTEGS